MKESDKTTESHVSQADREFEEAMRLKRRHPTRFWLMLTIVVLGGMVWLAVKLDIGRLFKKEQETNRGTASVVGPNTGTAVGVVGRDLNVYAPSAIPAKTHGWFTFSCSRLDMCADVITQVAR